MLPRGLSRICSQLAGISTSRLIGSSNSARVIAALRYVHWTGNSPLPTLGRNSRITARLKQLSTSSNGDGQEATADSEEELMEDLEQDVTESGKKQFNFKELLYQRSNDDVIVRMNGCSGPEELLQISEELNEKFTEQHATQFIILLWFWLRQADRESINKIVNSSPQFQNFLDRLPALIPKMNYEEKTCSLLYLQRIGVDSGHQAMQQLLIRLVDELKQDSCTIPLSALSRFAVAVNSNADIYTCLVSKEIVPHTFKCLENCSDAEQIRLITICMQHLNHLVTGDMFEFYQKKVKELIANGRITKSDVRSILKIINFINIPRWSQVATDISRSLLLLLLEEIPSLSAKELAIVFRVVQSQLEPASIIPNLKEAASSLFERCPTVETLDCVIRFLESKQRYKMISSVENMINNETVVPAQLPLVFRILRSLKISDINLCNKYWSLVLEHIRQNIHEQDTQRLTKHCHRYMHFNNNLGGTYHHKQLEDFLCSVLMTDIERGLSGIVPSVFARSASFIIAYGGEVSHNERIPAIIVEKMEGMATQFSIYDCLQLSRGLQIANEMRFRHTIFSDVAVKLNRISNVLDESAERQLQQDLNLHDLNQIVRSFINRRASRKTLLFQTIMDRYRRPVEYLNSRLIRDVTYNLATTNYVIPEICESVLEYVLNNRDYVTGDTAEKVLTCCYSIGYTPKDFDVVHWCDEIVRRDFKFMNSLSIVQACLALCFYKSLSEELIHKVFTIDYIQQVEDEIKECYSKETYPERILNQVMQLNRAVCLDYPEAQVPWFQQNYIEAQMSKLANIQTKFYTDIKNLLVLVVNDDKLLKCNHVTPYGYRIDFVVHLNRNNMFIAPPKNSEVMEKISKVAILLQKLDSFCENKFTAMKGSELLRLRHLEILGYKVVYINFNEWNSMYMNMPGAKVDYLKNLLQIQ